jgi:phosphohistidine swiveling domain-containing protein
MSVTQPVRVWHGRGASFGSVIGRARLVATDADITTASPDEVVISRHATQGLLPALLGAGGAVCQTGGLFNHLAILARELGKPCVTGCSNILDEVEPGCLLRIDGSTGVVEALAPSGDATGPSQARAHQPDPATMVPLLQFGRFTAAFQPVDITFGFEAALRTAALVSLPTAFDLGDPLEVAVAGNRILVGRVALEELVDLLVEGMAARTFSPAAIRRRHESGCAWEGWDSIAREAAPLALLVPAVQEYFLLNQLTWVAGIAKEPLAKRYEEFLETRLSSTVGASGRRELFLGSLVTPGLSYILRAGSGMAAADHAGSAAGRTGNGAKKAWDTSKLIDGDGEHRAAMSRLREHLDEKDFRHADSYVTSLTDLATVTEGKNTVLSRCSRVLLGDDRNHAAVLSALDLSEADVADDGDPERRKRLVHTVADRLSGELRQLSGELRQAEDLLPMPASHSWHTRPRSLGVTRIASPAGKGDQCPRTPTWW